MKCILQNTTDCNGKHIPLHDKFENGKKLILIAHFRYLRYANCNFRLLKESSPPLFFTLVSSIITPLCATLHLISLLSRSPSLFFGGPVLDLLRPYTASGNRSVRGGRLLSPARSNMTLLDFISLDSLPSGPGEES